MNEDPVFLLQPYENNDQHAVIDLDKQIATQLINDGKATRVSLGEYDEFRKKAQEIHTEYKKAEKKIKASDNPLHNDEYKAYELKKAYEQFEQQTKALQAEYKQKREEMQANAREKAARATVKVSTSDKQTAEQVANRLSLSIAGASNAAQLSDIISTASDNISYLSDAEKVAIQGEMAGIISHIEAKADKYGVKVSAKGIISSAQDVRNMDLLGVKVAEQLPTSIDMEYRRLKAVKSRR